MANSEHLDVLKQGAEVWNRWRDENLAIIPNLSGANPSGANLSGANLSGANLILANLVGMNLKGTEFSLATLIGTKLKGADLSGANLTSANLMGADLNGANLTLATLHKTFLSDTNLTLANLGGANMSLTTLTDIDLSRVEGLESVRHLAPSSLGIDTIYKSQGNIPEAFLRGCGIDDTFIANIKAFTSTPFEYFSCFISHSTGDQEFATRLHIDLDANNVRNWYYPEDIKTGDDLLDTIDRQIRARDKLLIVLSENSVASGWVETEVKAALDEERRRKQPVLFPVMLDRSIFNSDEPWARLVLNRHITDFSNWKDHDSYQTALERILRDLKNQSSDQGHLMHLRLIL